MEAESQGDTLKRNELYQFKVLPKRWIFERTPSLAELVATAQQRLRTVPYLSRNHDLRRFCSSALAPHC